MSNHYNSFKSLSLVDISAKRYRPLYHFNTTVGRHFNPTLDKGVCDIVLVYAVCVGLLNENSHYSQLSCGE